MTETICAIATPLGVGGIGIVRISGSGLGHIAEKVFGKCPEPRMAEYGEFRDENKTIIDTGIALYFPGPNSFTGEDVLELQGHGGRVVQEMLCDRILELGARLARPGEFTERAFLNDRIDLAQAEAVADLIQATSEQAARASARSLTGEFSKEVLAIDQEILNLRVYMEGAIDFAEEEIDFLADEEIGNRVQEIMARLSKLLERTKTGAALQKGLNVVIAGPPNVGKSSLLNALLNEDRAIVTEIAGTTRDTLDAVIHIEGLPIHLMDTAGIHESDDEIEVEGIKRAEDAIARGDLVLWVVDDRTHDSKANVAIEVIEVRNKCDLSNNDPGFVQEGHVRISALHRLGLDELRSTIQQKAGWRMTDDAFAGRPRHISSLTKALESICDVKQLLSQKAGEIAAEELRHAHSYLGEIVGDTTTDDLLGEIFSKFCIGK